MTDSMDIITDYDVETNDLKATYLTPFLDENLLKEDFTGPGPVLAWYMQDGLGSVRQLVVGKRVTNSYTYTAWGVPLNWQEDISNRYTYTSREYNAESGDYYYRARHYTPTLGRFTTPDPLISVKLYAYVSNNPVRYIDSYGKQEKHKGEEPSLKIEIWWEVDVAPKEELKFGTENFIIEWTAWLNIEPSLLYEVKDKGKEKIKWLYPWVIQKNIEKWEKLEDCKGKKYKVNKVEEGKIWDYWYLPIYSSIVPGLFVKDSRWTKWPEKFMENWKHGKKFCAKIVTKSTVYRAKEVTLTTERQKKWVIEHGAFSSKELAAKGREKVGEWTEIVTYNGCVEPPKYKLEVVGPGKKRWTREKKQ